MVPLYMLAILSRRFMRRPVALKTEAGDPGRQSNR